MSNFCERIAEAAERFPARTAIELVGGDRVSTLTYLDLETLAGRFATMLRDQYGVGRGDRVAILAANDGRWIAAYLGTLRLGAVAVPLDTAYSPTQVATLVGDCEARVLCTSDRLRDVADAAAAAVGPQKIAVLPLSTNLDDVPPVTTIETRADSDAAAILYTSGTTADPKGVVLMHGNLEAERASALGVIHVTEQDAVLGVLPLFHALAQMANLLLPLSAGARVVFLEAVNSTSLLEALEARHITIFACVPQFFYLIHQRVIGEVSHRGRLSRALFRTLVSTNVWLRDHLGWNPGRRVFHRVHAALGSDMRLLITGGSRFDPSIARDLYGLGLTLLNGYGLTETSGAATLVRPGDRFTTSVGQPLPGVDVRIAPDAAGTASDDAGADSGEILIRGPIVMREYFHRPDATREVLEDGWLRTGDLGRLDAQGRVYITGRKKEVIVLSSGKNLYPEEIEAHYRQSAFVQEICVMGLTEPGAPSAERLHAVVVPDERALRERGAVNLRELIRFELEELSVKLPAHKRILGYDIAREPLPRTTTGKLKRREIERQHRARAASVATDRALTAEERTWLETGAHQAAVDTISQRTGRRLIRPDDNLELDLQLDSMERVELLTALERDQHTRVAPDARATIFTVRQLVDAVTAAPAAGDSVPADSDGSSMWDAILAAEPDADVSRLLSRPTRWRALFLYAVLQIILLAMRLGVRVRVNGRAALPADPPFIISPNHQSYLDAFVVTAALPFRVFRRLFFVGAAEHFQTPLMKFAARSLNVVPVDPDANLVNAMRAAATGLRLGKVLILFPEGERAIDGEIRAFRKGAAILATHLRVPIVPVALDGLFPIWPRGRGVAWRRLLPGGGGRITVQFAAPMTVTGSYADGTGHLQAAVTALLTELRAR